MTINNENNRSKKGLINTDVNLNDMQATNFPILLKRYGKEETTAYTLCHKYV